MDRLYNWLRRKGTLVFKEEDWRDFQVTYKIKYSDLVTVHEIGKYKVEDVEKNDRFGVWVGEYGQRHLYAKEEF